MPDDGSSLINNISQSISRGLEGARQTVKDYEASVVKMGDSAKTSFAAVRDAASSTSKVIQTVHSTAREAVSAIVRLGVEVGALGLVWKAHRAEVNATVNVYRGFRIVSGPVGAATVAVGVLAESFARVAMAQDKIIQRNALIAARTGQTFQSISTLTTTERLLGVNADSLNKFGKTESQLIELQRAFRDLKDPVEQAQFAVANFGTGNAEPGLIILRKNTEQAILRARELNAVYDRETRIALRGFSESLMEPLNLLGRLRTEMKYVWEAAKIPIVLTVATVYKNSGGTSISAALDQAQDPLGVMPRTLDTRRRTRGDFLADMGNILGRQQSMAGRERFNLGDVDAAVSVSGRLESERSNSALLAAAESKREEIRSKFDSTGTSTRGLWSEEQKAWAEQLVNLDKRVRALRAVVDAEEAAVEEEKRLTAVYAELGQMKRAGMTETQRTWDDLLRLFPDAGPQQRGMLWQRFEGARSGDAAWNRAVVPEFLSPFQQQMADAAATVNPLSSITREPFADYFATRDRDKNLITEQSRGILSAGEHQARLTELRAGPGMELQALREALDIRLRAAKADLDSKRARFDLFEIEKEEAAFRREEETARYRFEEAIAQKRREELQNYKDSVMRAFDALISGGSGGLSAFFRSQSLGMVRTIVGNLAGETFGALRRSGVIPHAGAGTTLGRILGGTPMGPELNANTVATAANTAAVTANTATRAVQGATGAAGALGGVAGAAGDLAGLPSAATAASSGGFGAGIRAAGITSALALAGGAVGIRSGIGMGGARGALTAASAGLGATGILYAALAANPEPITKAVMAIAAIGTGLAVAAFGDPKKKYEEAESRMLDAARYDPPASIHRIEDMYGRGISYDRTGSQRPIVVNINAMDAKSFIDHSADIGAALRHHLQNSMVAASEIREQLGGYA